MNRFYIFFLFIFMSSAFSQNAKQNFLAQGQLKDALNGDALAYANVGLLVYSDSVFIKGTTTDIDGKFDFKNLDSGSFYLRISYMGYPTSLIPIEVSQKQTNLGVIKISKTSQTLDAVSIVAEKLMYQYEADKKVYNVTEDASVQGGSASDALQNAPGVWVDLEGNITLRGVDNVEIWLNDKPSRIPADGLKTYLQQLPANTLERIEVMTNPSAKYSASGTAGIINIVTKQKIKQNFLFSAGINASTQTRINPWISYVWSNKKFKFNVYASHSSQTHEWNSTNKGTVKNAGNPLYDFLNSSLSESQNQWSSIYLDGEYNISEKSRFNAYFGGNISSGDNTSAGINERFSLSDSINISIQRLNPSESSGKNWYAGGSFNHDFIPQKHYINFDFSLGQWINNNKTENFEKSLIEQHDLEFQRNRNFLSENNYIGTWYDLDFTYFNNFNSTSTVESGFSLNYSPIDHEAPVDTFDFVLNQWIYSPLFSNYKDAFSRKANAYVSWSQKIKTFNYKIGLRGEYQYNFLNSLSTAQQVESDYFGIFPSAHLSYQTSKKYSYTASYSRRVQYPHIWYLDPFISYINEESIWMGNPNLKPAYTNSFELGSSKYFEKVGFLSLSLYHRRTDKSHTNSLEAVYDSYLNRYTIYQFMTNSGRDIFTGADVTFTYRPKPFMNILVNVNAYNKDIYAELDSYTVQRNDFSYDAKISFSSSFLKRYQVQMMSFYRSKSPTLQGHSNGMFFANASLRADFFERKLSVHMSVQDMFNTQKSKSETNTPSIYSVSKSWSNSQYVLIGLTFRIGKIELEKEQKRGDVNQVGGAPGI
ncbi:MAG: outer membrane beta-barrel family protein [Bacteroidales bacterium]|nr:outer membrane beta-barrel family protein [Bacteroidales bacterium]